jgi:hypothetical protein
MDQRYLYRKQSTWPRLLLFFHCLFEIGSRFSSLLGFNENFLWALLDKFCKLNVCRGGAGGRREEEERGKK